MLNKNRNNAMKKKKLIFLKNIILSSHDTLKSLSIKQRSKYLLDVAYLMEARLDEFTLMEYIQRSGMYVCVIAKTLHD